MVKKRKKKVKKKNDVMWFSVLVALIVAVLASSK
jgi:uncharacterized membrane protein YvbJ